MRDSAPWERYKTGDILQQHQRVSRTEGHDERLDAPVWIDKMQPYYGDHPEGLPAAREILQRHAAASHPTLPTLLDAWERDGALVWVYRARGEQSLTEFLDNHRPSLAVLRPLVADLAMALAALHDADLHHGALAVDAVGIVGKRRLALTTRGLRHAMNEMLNRSTLETGIDKTPTSGPSDDIAAWGMVTGVLMTGDVRFGQTQFSVRATATFDPETAAKALRKAGLTGRLPEVVLRAAASGGDDKESTRSASYPSIQAALEDFLDAVVRETNTEGRVL